MATLQGKAVKNTYRQVLQIGANNVGVSGSLQPVQDGAGVNTALSLSTAAATVNGDLTITGDLIITGGGIQIQDLIDDTVASLIQNGTGITWTYNDAARTLTGNFTGTTTVVPEGTNLYYTQGRFDSAFAAKSTTNLAEGTNLYFTTARGNANFATNLAASDTDDLDEGTTNLYYTEARATNNFDTNLAASTTTDLAEGTNLYFTNSRARLALDVTAGTGISYNNGTGVFALGSIPNSSLTNSSVTINSQAVSLGGSVTLTTTNIAEGTNLYWTNARFDSRFGTKTTTDLAEGTNLYYTQTRFNTAFSAKTTTDLAEGTNLYYTDARSRAAFSENAVGLDYSSGSGVLSLTSGYAIPTTVKLGEYDTAYNRSIVSAAVTGTGTKTLSLTQQDANVVTATWTDQGITTINGTANQIAATTVGNTTTLAFTNDVTMPNNLVVSGNLTINGTATYVNTESISSKDPLFEVANTNNTTDAVDIGYYGRYYDAIQERVEFTGLFRDASDAGKFKIFTGLVDEPTNVVNTTGTGYTVATLVANVDGNLAGTANAANILSTARTIAASGDATWSVSFDGSANATAALTLANTGVTATTYGTSTSVPTIAVDAKGRITSASNTNIAFPVTTVNGFAGTVVLTTSDVAEGSNQYFTTARAQAAITGGASSVVTANLTASRALVSDGTGKIAASATTTTTEIGYLAGVTSALQTQLDGKLNLTGGTLTGPLIGTTGSFSSSGSGDTFTIGHTSGSGIALNITKNGNGEGLYINKASGSGNALTVIGSTSLGALAGTSATFSSTLGVTGALNGSTASFTGNIQTQNSSGVSFSALNTAGGFAKLEVTANASSNAILSYTNDLTINGGTLSIVPVTTFASSVTAASFISSSTGNANVFNSASATTGWVQIAMQNTSGSAILAIESSVAGTTTNGSLAYATILRNYTATDLQFATNNIVRATITSGGNLGIGTSSPAAKTEIRINSNDYGNNLLLSNNFPASGIATSISFGHNTAAVDNDIMARISGYVDDRTSGNRDGSLRFYTATGGSLEERLRIRPNGNLLVGGLNYQESPLCVNASGVDANSSTDLLMHLTNTKYSSASSSGENKISFGWGNHYGASFGAYKQSVNLTGFRFYGEQGYNTPALILEITAYGAILSPFTYSNTTGSGANMSIDSNGVFYRSTSSLKYKKEVKNYDKGLAEVMSMRPVYYKGKSENDGDTQYAGLIAEEVHELGLTEFVQYAQDGTPDALAYSNMIALAFKAIQELKAEIDELKAK